MIARFSLYADYGGDSRSVLALMLDLAPRSVKRGFDGGRFAGVVALPVPVRQVVMVEDGRQALDETSVPG